jgi:hypothetical protein
LFLCMLFLVFGVLRPTCIKYWYRLFSRTPHNAIKKNISKLIVTSHRLPHNQIFWWGKIL